MIFFICWLTVSMFVALIAKNINRSGFSWFIVSIIFSPIIALIALAVVGKSESEQEIEIKQKQLKLYESRVEDFITVYIQNEDVYKKNAMLFRLFQQLSNNKNSSTLDELDKAILLMSNSSTSYINSGSIDSMPDQESSYQKRIKILIKLHQDELISTDEFENKKAEILSEI